MRDGIRRSIPLDQHRDSLATADAEADEPELWSLRSISLRILVTRIAPEAATG